MNKDCAAMINETVETTMTETLPNTFGAKLKATREAQGLERKDVATQLRLNERFIVMMEENNFPKDLPATFIRGYLRAYSKLLQIAEFEVTQALETILPQSTVHQVLPVTLATSTLTSGNYFMQMFTYLIVFTLVGLMGTWWYTHSNTSSTDTQMAPLIPMVANTIQVPITTTQAPEQIAGALGPKLAEAQPIAPTNTLQTASVESLNANGGVDRHKLDSNKNVDRHNHDDDDRDDTESNDDNDN